MPPRLYSRHTYVEGVVHGTVETQRCTCNGSDQALPADKVGTIYLTDRVPFRYRVLPDNINHVVGAGDSWWTLAGKYYVGIPRPSGLWWVITDFQPKPVFDPTIQLAPGQVIVVPSLRTVLERVFDERRRAEHVEA